MFKRVLATAPVTATSALRTAVNSTARTSFAARTATPIVQQNGRRSYHEKVLDHYNNPRNVGSMKKSDADVGTGLVGAPACGDVMKLQIKVGKDKDGKDMIEDVKFKTFGCGSAIASSSYLTELVRGMTLEQAGRIKNTEIAKELCLPPVKLHCSMLAEDAIKSAINNYYTKNPQQKATDLGGTGAAMPKIEVETVTAAPA
ncbi:Putative NIF system FeS cluster assembly, NifU, ISC system FeS cluster assembly, IscU scaffold [Septoria linicola]|uniref:Iron-sulfur cluster assembly protein n=1 Tax=Septoria linicola TaxID=215465 RepID=A0A9Q9B1Q6_9PEZI|nr:putative NIF system FeS cluster assembly, NifU, ISC system FeS cluster assembly, IscU scaffold [Septoria linicola]USW56590.1 Putative NIF system FeS cluster assembly, NifU, ISC system FeS cluster assembly, IscU scaffold [Septoria linicola]